VGPLKVKLLNFTQDAEKICAIAARVCCSPIGIDEISKRLTKDEVEKLLKNIISARHHSILEHCSFTFGIEGISRILLAQLTRHRVASFAVQSQRRVTFKDGIEFVIPDTIRKNEALLKKYNDIIENIKLLYKEFLEANIPAEDARYILPSASMTKIVITMNARELRHFFALRCCNKAQRETRDLACRMLDLVKKKAPLLFYDAGPGCVRDGCKEVSPCGKLLKKV